MAMGCQFGINQFTIHAYFKTSSVRGNQIDCFNLRLKFFEQFSRQTDGAIGIMSNSAIDQFDF